MEIETPRFLLRDFTERDRAAFVAYQCDPRYRRLYDITDGESGRAHDLFNLFLTWQREAPRRNFQLGIFEQASGRLCGCAGLRQVGEAAGDTALFGIELTPDDWGRYRLAVEAAAAMIGHGFDNLGIEAIIGSTASGNVRIERLARWFGGELIARREGPEWMQARGWAEVDWALPRERWMEAAGLRRKILHPLSA